MFMANLLLTNPCLSQRHHQTADPLTFKHLPSEFMTVGNTPTTRFQETPSLASLARQPTVSSHTSRHILIRFPLSILKSLPILKPNLKEKKKSTFLRFKIQVQKSFFLCQINHFLKTKILWPSQEDFWNGFSDIIWEK